MPIRSDPGATIAARGQRRAAPPGASGAIATTSASIERVRASLPGPLARVPVAALSAWGGVIAIAMVVLFAVSVRSAKAIEILEEDEATTAGASSSASASAAPTAPAAPVKPPVRKAKSADLAAARLAGTDALAQLAQRYPEDPAVLRELFLAQARSPKAHAAALRAARRLLEASRDAGDDDDVRRALLSLANGPSDTATVALDLIANEMGKRGVELLFEVANGSVQLSKAKAGKLLADPEIRKNATPALLIANDLRASLPCARKTLLARAKEEGDARSLSYLRPLTNAGCGGGFFRRGQECYRCFTPAERIEIKAVIGAIEARSPAAAPSATAVPSASSPH